MGSLWCLARGVAESRALAAGMADAEVDPLDPLNFSPAEAAELIQKVAGERVEIFRGSWQGAAQRHRGKEFPKEWEEGGAHWQAVEAARKALSEERAVRTFNGLVNSSAVPLAAAAEPAADRSAVAQLKDKAMNAEDEEIFNVSATLSLQFE